MTHLAQSNSVDGVVQLLSDYGSEGMVAAIETLMNEAMKLELAEALMTRTAELVWSM